MERQAHEAVLAAFLVTLASYFYIKFLKTHRLLFGLEFVISLFLALFAYQSSRLFAAFFFVFSVVYFLLLKKKEKVTTVFMIFFVIALLLFAVTDIIYKPTRVQNLFLTSTTGFAMKINELRGEGGKQLFYNKLSVGAREVFNQELQYFSPQFLAEDGDKNLRFGFQGMSPMTPLEYIFVFVGLYFLFKNKEPWRYFILSLFLTAPLTAALSWQEISLTRSLFLIIPAIILSAYGLYNTLLIARKKNKLPYVLAVFILIESYFLYYSWDFYFNHYPKRAVVVRSWQCGYKDLASYIQANYSKYNKFYITQKNGEPYIFLLYYLHYPPNAYQKQARLTAPDQFGFGQVEQFDKFTFSFQSSATHEKKVVLIGYPDDFGQLQNVDKNKIKKIKIGTEEFFWIYEL
jgi:hypothetical protein